MKKRPEYHKKKLLEALENNLGIITSACKDVGITRESYYRYYKEDEEFRKKVDEINEITLDFAETQLLRKIREGSERSILFYMKYRGRSRGYNEELNINANINIEQPLFLDDNDDDSDDE